jgi:hypothetical protein
LLVLLRRAWLACCSWRLDPDQRDRAVLGASKPSGQTLALFVTVLFITILLSIPGQSYSVLGVAFVALAVISGVGLLMLDRRARADTHQRDTGAHAIALTMDAIAPSAIASILLLVAGVLLIFGVRAGLDVVVLPVLVALGPRRRRHERLARVDDGPKIAGRPALVSDRRIVRCGPRLP